MNITPSLQLALHLHNAGVANARADYYAHPTASCLRVDCDGMVDHDTVCPVHRREIEDGRARRAKRGAA